MPMASPALLPVPWKVPLPRFRTSERVFWQGAALMAGLLLVFQVLHWVEIEYLQRPASACVVRRASEAAARYIGIPHVIIGFLFSVTSAKNRSLPRRLGLLGLLVAGAVVCFIYGGTGLGATTMAIFLYVYFLIHELRDEVFFYTLLGDAPPIADRARFQRRMRGLIGLWLLGLAVVLWWPGWVLGWFHLVPSRHFQGLTPPVHALLVVAPAALWLAGMVLWLRGWGREESRSVAICSAAMRRSFGVFAGVFLVAALGMMLGYQQSVYLPVLLHVTVWYVFSSRQLAGRKSASVSSGWWPWMRTTQAGFQVLHVGLVLVLLGLGVLCVYGTGQQGWLWQMLAPAAFAHWTIMHVSVSFLPR